MSIEKLNNYILKVESTRVWRTYFGGMEIEKWQGLENPGDGNKPEDWLASTVKAHNPGRENIKNEGLSKIRVGNDQYVLLKDIIDMNPVAFLGEKHFNKLGNNMGVLVKMIDSFSRLTIQVHPDKQIAKTVFSSNYGKTEAWYILGGRTIDGEEPYVLLGFKPEITREKWEELFWKQDIEGMLSALHKVYVKPGEVYFIEGGVPHAIGSGCFLIEIQEPTDYTIRVERKTPEGKAIAEELIHQGAGFDRIFDCFHYDNYTFEETLKRWRIQPITINNSDEAIESVLIGEQQTNLFKMKSYVVKNECKIDFSETFMICVIVSGEGSMTYKDDRKIDVKQGEVVFVPANIGEIKVVSNSISNMEIVICNTLI